MRDGGLVNLTITTPIAEWLALDVELKKKDFIAVVANISDNELGLVFELDEDEDSGAPSTELEKEGQKLALINRFVRGTIPAAAKAL